MLKKSEHHSKKHKEFYDKLLAEEEANEDYKKWSEMMFSKLFPPHSNISELKYEDLKFEKLDEMEDGEEDTSSIGNSWVDEFKFNFFFYIKIISPKHAFLDDGSQPSSSDITHSDGPYFSSDEEYI